MNALLATDYTSDAAWQRDLDTIFGRSWLCAGHAGRIVNPGDALAVQVCDRPLVFVRQPDGTVRGLYNVCQHRAAPVVWGGEVKRDCRQLICRYHGWAYGLDGRCLARPGMPKGTVTPGLRTVATREWSGLLFVSFSGHPPDFDAFIAPFATACSGALNADWDVGEVVRHEMACNWKVYVDNYLEGWHIPFVHPSLSQEVDMRTYRVVPGIGFATHHADTRPESDAVNDGFWGWLWPNVAVNVYRSGMSLERIVPLAKDRTAIEYTYLFANDASADERHQLQAMSQQTTQEDARIVEAVHLGLASGVVPQGPLSPLHEHAVHAFHQQCRDAWAAP